MKCNYCGNELENGAQFCDKCGMILGFSEEEKIESGNTKKAAEESFQVPEYVPNVFCPVDETEEINEPARELEADITEEKVEVTENIPEYISSIPEYTPVETKLNIEEILAGKIDPENQVPVGETATETETASEEAVAEAVEEADDASDEAAAETAEEVVTAQQEPQDEPVMEDIYSQVEEPAQQDEVPMEQESDSSQQEDAQTQQDVIRVPESDITYPEYDDYNSKNKEESLEPEEEFEDISDFVKREIDGKKKTGGKKKTAKNGKSNPIAVAAVMILVVAVCLLVAFSDKLLPEIKGPTEDTVGSTEQVSEDDTTEQEPSEENTTESDTTDEATSEDDTTEQEPSEEDTTETATEEPTAQTTEPSTTEPSTTEPSTTAPTTTHPVTQPTTQSPTTTRPVTQPTTQAPTTQPSTAAPTTTNPYGINDVDVATPDVYYPQAKILYCTEEGVIFRSAPSLKSERVLYLSKGADLTVLGEKNGFCYARSNRYGVYGWVSKSYLSASRPETEETTVHTGTVTPDKYYETAVVKYTIDGLNIRKGPGTDYGVVGLIIKGYPVKVIGYSSKVSGWVYVTDVTYGISGWVSAAYLK